MVEKVSLKALVRGYAAGDILFENVLAGASQVKLSTTERDESYNSYNGESWESDPDNSQTFLDAAIDVGYITAEEYEQILDAIPSL